MTFDIHPLFISDTLWYNIVIISLITDRRLEIKNEANQLKGGGTYFYWSGIIKQNFL